MSEHGHQPSAIVVGRGPAEAKAALDLARAGAEVTLLNPCDWLTPGTDGPAGVPTLLEAVRHPRISVLTGAAVENIESAARPGGQSGLRVTVRQLPRYVDPERCTACGACAQVCPVLLPGGGSSARFPRLPGSADGELRPATADAHHTAIHRGGVPTTYAIDKAGTAPCRHACPIDQRAQGYVALIRAGNLEAAYRTIKRENPFPSVCGRVCDHRCEETCTRCDVDEPVAVMALKRFVADWAAKVRAKSGTEIAPRSGYHVAVVGAGPAGLTAARELNRLGHNVTVLEALPVPGGMMRVGIPAFRLPRERLQWEIDEILNEGVELHTNSRVDNVATLFSQGYNAVVLALGLHVSRRLAIPGAEELELDGPGEGGLEPGVTGAVEFLRRVNLGERPSWSGRRVVVVGGGSAAMDTARVCRRLGAEVEVIYRRSRAEMPAHDFEVDDAQREGVIIRFLTNPTQVLRQNGRVIAIECVRMELGEPDDSGRCRPLPVEGSGFRLSADAVLMAIGQTNDLSKLLDGMMVVRHDGTVQHDPVTLMTAQSGLFVAGDVAGTEGFVVDAIASGARAARAVDRYLRGVQGVADSSTQPVVRLSEQQVSQRLRGAAPKGTPRAAGRSVLPQSLLGDFGETEVGLTEAEAMAEAARCLGCGLCSECLACVDVCPAKAINHEAQTHVFGLQVGAVVWVDGDSRIGIDESDIQIPGVFAVGNGVSPSDTVDRAFLHLGLAKPTLAVSVAAPSRWQVTHADIDYALNHRASRFSPLGVFLCRCGGEIERVVNLPAVATRVEGLPGVTYVGAVEFACHQEGYEVIRSAMAANGLTGAVLAACSCCALDQICWSCTTQRTRCKEQLGVWDGLRGLPVEFVNVREQCAYVHSHNPAAATLKAGDMIAASVAVLGAARGGAQRAPALVPSRASRIPITAAVDPVRCRGCEDCETVCGLQAIRVIPMNGVRTAQVDVARCLGCGVCLAVCSSGALLASDLSDSQVVAMLAAMDDLTDKTIVFSCNWGAYSAIEAAGVEGLAYDPSVRLVRLMCAGRAHAGLILRAFAQGAARVLVVACGHEGTQSLCHYHTGYEQASRSVKQVQQMLSLLGIDPARLALAEMAPGDGAGFAAAVEGLVRTASPLVHTLVETPAGQM